MADEWANVDVEAGKKTKSAEIFGEKVRCIVSTFEVAAADDDGDFWKLGRLPANAIPVQAELVNDAITGSTDWDLGLYTPDLSAADVDLFDDGVDIASGNAITSPQALLQTGPSIDEVNDKLWELLGLSVPTFSEYILALTANTVGSAAGTVSVRFWYIVG